MVWATWHHDCLSGSERFVMSRNKKTAVLVAEREGDWSSWVEPLRGEVDDIAIVLQRMGETPSELATRVRERVGEIASSCEVVAAALVGGERWDPDTLNARSQIIRAIVSHMASIDEGRLYLDAGTSAGRSRHAMEAIASVVADHVGSHVDIVTTHGPRPRPAAAGRRAA